MGVENGLKVRDVGRLVGIKERRYFIKSVKECNR